MAGAASAVWCGSLLEEMRRRILVWYDTSRRHLPWRGDSSPYGLSTTDSTRPLRTIVSAYGTWVSEIMLQQTRVETVIPYYTRWMERWPTVEDLARASDDDVAAMWAGLGFYRRCRNLHAGSKMIAAASGTIPCDVRSLKLIPGIGDYTAGAISSIAFGAAEAVVDGNVVRVLCRLQVRARCCAFCTNACFYGCSPASIYRRSPSNPKPPRHSK
jgi:A/G-specific adenine glycosylase